MFGGTRGSSLYDSRAMRYLLSEKRLLVKTGIILLSQALVVALLPLPLKYLVDEVLLLTGKDAFEFALWRGQGISLTVDQVVIPIVAILAILGGLAVYLDYVQEFVVAKTASRVIANVRQELLRTLIIRRLRFFDNERKVNVLGHMSGDAANINFLVSSVLTTLMRSVPTVIFIIVSILWVDYRFALVLTLILPMAVFLSAHFTKKARNALREFRRESVRLETDFYELLQAFPLIKSLKVEDRIAKRLDQRIDHVGDRLIDASRTEGKLLASLSGTKHISRFLVVAIGSYAVLRNSLTVGELVVFLSYIELLTKPIAEVAKLSNKLARAQVSIERIEKLFDRFETAGAEHDPQDGPSINELNLTLPKLDVQNVTLRLGDEVEICTDFSGKLEAGQLVAFAGPSGAGKSTFAKVFNRLLEVDSGEVLLNGENIKQISLNTLRRYVCLLSQESYFVHGTIRENLELAVDGPVGERAMRAALKKVNALGFVDNLEEGLDTRVGEGGRVLSGGQVRRLNLARAFLRKDAGVFIFDEASSGLDPYSADMVFAAAKDLAREGKIVLWVTHREAEITGADSVLKFSPVMNPVWQRDPVAALESVVGGVV